MISVVYNNRCGRFELSELGLFLYNEKRKADGLSMKKKSRPVRNDRYSIDRTDTHLVEVVKELGEKANGEDCKLQVCEIPIEYRECYTIDDYYGLEKIICDPHMLAISKLKNINLNHINDNDCRNILADLINTIMKAD